MSLKAIGLLRLWKKERKKYCIAKNSLQNSSQYSLQYSNQYSSQYSPQYSNQYSLQYGQMILMSIVLVYLLPLPLVFVYFLDCTFPKNKKPVNDPAQHEQKQDQPPKRRHML